MADISAFHSELDQMADHLEQLAAACREGRMRMCAIQAVYIQLDEPSDDEGPSFYDLDHYARTEAEAHELLGTMSHHMAMLNHGIFGPKTE